MSYLDHLLRIIAPHRCLGCSQEGSICCEKCIKELRLNPGEIFCYNCNLNISKYQLALCNGCSNQLKISGAVYVANYSNGLAKNLIKGLKFNQIYEAAEVMAKAISKQLPLLKIDRLNEFVITAAPTSGKRARSRGWDQAVLIAKQLAKTERLPYRNLLLRTSTFDQIGSGRVKRKLEADSFFKPIRANFIEGKNIILVDDLVTTGATLNSAAKTLQGCGAKEIYICTFARTDLQAVFVPSP
jgi:competence protein ComFC